MSMRKFPRSSNIIKRKYCFKIAGCQQQIRKPIVTTKEDEEWLKKFFIN